MILRDTGEKIGTCGYHLWSPEKGEVEIGYDLQPAYWQRGYMSEAITAVIQFAIEKMQVKKIFTHISVDNYASMRTSEKVGFVKTGNQYYEEFQGQKYLHDIYCFEVRNSK